MQREGGAQLSGTRDHHSRYSAFLSTNNQPVRYCGWNKYCPENLKCAIGLVKMIWLRASPPTPSAMLKSQFEGCPPGWNKYCPCQHWILGCGGTSCCVMATHACVAHLLIGGQYLFHRPTAQKAKLCFSYARNQVPSATVPWTVDRPVDRPVDRSVDRCILQRFLPWTVNFIFKN